MAKTASERPMRPGLLRDLNPVVFQIPALQRSVFPAGPSESRQITPRELNASLALLALEAYNMGVIPSEGT